MLPSLHPTSVRVHNVASLVVASALSVLSVGACATGTTIGDGGSGGDGSGGVTSSSTKAASTTTSGVTSGPSSTSNGGAGPGPGPSTSGPGPSTSVATTGSGMSPPGTLFFSEYVEGSSNNKALEIYNAGPTPVDLTNCEIDRYMNGSTTASSPIALTPMMLGSGQVFVICNTSFSQPALCDQLSGSVQHTGNDVVEIVCGGTLLDAIGTIGDGNAWGTAPTTTMDATLRRKCTVTVGDTNPNDAFDPAAEWDGFPIDTFSDLGKYLCP